MEIAAARFNPVQSQPFTAGSRRLKGLLLGVLVGLAYGAVSGYINHFLLRDIPYYQPPFGSFGNLLAAAVIGALAGLVTAWPIRRRDGVLAGVIISASLGALRVLSYRWFLSSTPPGGLDGFWFVFLGLCLVFAPLIFLLRLAIDAQQAHRDEFWLAWDRVRWLVVLLVIALIAGSFSLFSGRDFAALSQVAALLSQGQQAAQPSALPQILAVETLPGFWEHRDEPYQLLLIPSQEAAQGDEILVVAAFESGWNMLCTLASDQSLRKCEEPQPVPVR